MQNGSLCYASTDGVWVLRLSGDLRFTLSPAINQLLDQLFADPATEQFLLDLSEAENVDSTNLGVLARVAKFARERNQPAPIIISPNPNITQLLQGICFDQLFTIVADADVPTDNLAELAPLAAEERDMLALVLEAHRRLSDVDEKNRVEFAPLITALEQQTNEP